MSDPSTMSDEELNKVIDTGIEPEEPDTPEEPETPEAEEQPEEPAASEAVETPEEQPAPPSRREQLRIQQLLAKYGPPPERQQTVQPYRPEALDYNQTLDADPEVIQQLDADRQNFGQNQYNEGLRRAEFLDWRTSLKIDAPTIEQRYPILNPKSEDFHPAVADALNTMYLKMSGFDAKSQTVANNDISYADFVESNMELVEEIAGQKNVQSAKNIAKQAATTGLRPDGSSAKRLNLNQSEKDMSLEELYAAIGQTPPK